MQFKNRQEGVVLLVLLVIMAALLPLSMSVTAGITLAQRSSGYIWQHEKSLVTVLNMLNRCEKEIYAYFKKSLPQPTSPLLIALPEGCSSQLLHRTTSQEQLNDTEILQPSPERVTGTNLPIYRLDEVDTLCHYGETWQLTASQMIANKDITVKSIVRMCERHLARMAIWLQ